MKLKSCPFCGTDCPNIYHKTSSDHKQDWYYFVECRGCEATGPHGDSETEANNFWNEREIK